MPHHAPQGPHHIPAIPSGVVACITHVASISNSRPHLYRKVLSTISLCYKPSQGRTERVLMVCSRAWLRLASSYAIVLLHHRIVVLLVFLVSR